MKATFKFWTLVTASLTILVTFSNALAEQNSETPFIVNFHTVTKNSPEGITIYRGSRLTDDASVSYLASLGVKTVIDLQGGDVNVTTHGRHATRKLDKEMPHFEKGETPADIERERKMVISTGTKNGEIMKFYSMPLNSINEVSPWESAQIEIILKMMNDKSLQPIYIHCAHGADRTGLMVALFRVINGQMDGEDAKDEMQELGHNFGHYVFTHEMDDYFNSYVKDHNLK